VSLSEGKKDYYKLLTGTDRKKLGRFPKAKDSINAILTQAKSNHPVISLGYSSLGEQFLTEEERESHVHILGTTGEGKSKLIEYLIRYDVDNGHGLLLLDPSDNGDTAYKVLKYCAKVGHKKVVFIDPMHRQTHRKVITINPFKYEVSLQEMAVSYLMDAVRVLFQQADAASTPRIQKYLPALFRLLQKSGLTIHEGVYFSNFFAGEYRRDRIFEMHQNQYDRDVSTIREAFLNNKDYQFWFASTVNRLEPFYGSEYLDMCFGSVTGLDFMKMVRDGWVILVNLDPDSALDKMGSRLLGSVIINEILFAIKRLRNNDWKGVYYLYVDEAGEYITRRLATIIETKRKSGMRAILSHLHMGQFEDKRIADAVRVGAKIKAAFQIPDPEERMRVVKALYGGDLADRHVSHVLSSLPKQHAVIKKAKVPAVITEIPDTPDIVIAPEILEDYLVGVLDKEWYKDPEDIKRAFNDPFKPRAQREDSVPSIQSKVSDKRAGRKAGVPRHGDAPDQRPPVPEVNVVSPVKAQDPPKKRLRKVRKPGE
jgi:hypothetical protein